MTIKNPLVQYLTVFVGTTVVIIGIGSFLLKFFSGTQIFWTFHDLFASLIVGTIAVCVVGIAAYPFMLFVGSVVLIKELLKSNYFP